MILKIGATLSDGETEADCYGELHVERDGDSWEHHLDHFDAFAGDDTHRAHDAERAHWHAVYSAWLLSDEGKRTIRDAWRDEIAARKGPGDAP